MPRLDFAYPFDIDDCRAVYSHKVVSAKTCIHRSQRLSNDVGIGSGVHADIVGFGLYPVDGIDCHNRDSSPLPDRYASATKRWQKTFNWPRRGCFPCLSSATLCNVTGTLKPFLVERFQDV